MPGFSTPHSKGLLKTQPANIRQGCKKRLTIRNTSLLLTSLSEVETKCSIGPGLTLTQEAI